ncbi:helix-turn-helix domain-containing protein [Amycolatopsis rhizosphaerae]|uniref:Helix-turn-helix domain-containing protein n=1 Tax=Amycolatopsis rhizosphaerae TaxID=2053003 RepID=A0A558CPM4_9PSEU|nr:helix-turn-helix domain-containing protein [Amycolatopsis rhizosphaerae]TVT50726.1 helix-turn-helix domain-containing protein [Amycolatopsis rhizosphaerae]
MTDDRTTEIASLIARLAALMAARPQEEQPPRPLPPRVLLKVEEAAERLGIGRTTAYALVRSGELESVRIGSLRRIPSDALTAYAEQLLAKKNAA